MDISRLQKIVLSNGLRIVLLPDNRLRTASIGIWVGSGTRFETPETGGVSHFIEHMMFKGSNKRSSFDIAETIDSVGANLNAYTTKEYTCYYARTLDTHIYTVLDVICDMIINPRFDPEDVELEKGVICEEIGMYEDSPDDVMMDSLYGGVWSSSMLGSNILGTYQTVNSITSDIIRSYKNRRYTPERMVIAASGNFDPEKVLEFLKGYFENLPCTKGTMECEKAAYNRSIVVTKKKFEQTNICLGFPTMPLSHPDRYALSILSTVTGGSTSSRLFQQIREKLGLAYSVGSGCTHYLKEGLLEIDAGVNPASEEQAIDKILEILKDLKQNGITEREFSRAKEQLKASVVMGLESPSSKVASLGRTQLLENTARLEDDILSAVERISINDVNRIAAQYLDFSKCSVSAVGKSVKNRQFYLEKLEKIK